jgi:hypothetical protein
MQPKCKTVNSVPALRLKNGMWKNFHVVNVEKTKIEKY